MTSVDVSNLNPSLLELKSPSDLPERFNLYVCKDYIVVDSDNQMVVSLPVKYVATDATNENDVMKVGDIIMCSLEDITSSPALSFGGKSYLIIAESKVVAWVRRS